MTWIFRILWFLFKQQAETAILDAAKLKAIESYFKALHSVRKAVIAATVAIVLAQLFAAAVIGIFLSSIWLLDLSPVARLQIILGCSIALVLSIGLAFVYFVQEHRWYRASGAETLFEDFANEHSNLLDRQKQLHPTEDDGTTANTHASV